MTDYPEEIQAAIEWMIEAMEAMAAAKRALDLQRSEIAIRIVSDKECQPFPLSFDFSGHALAGLIERESMEARILCETADNEYRRRAAWVEVLIARARP